MNVEAIELSGSELMYLERKCIRETYVRTWYYYKNMWINNFIWYNVLPYNLRIYRFTGFVSGNS